MVIGIFTYAYFEADRIYMHDIMQLRLLQFDRSKVFDLARMSASGSGTSSKDKDSVGTSPVNNITLGNGHAVLAATVSNSKVGVVLKSECSSPICNGNGHVVTDTAAKSKVAIPKKKELAGVGFFKSLYRRFVGNGKTNTRKAQAATPERQISSEDDSGYVKPEQHTEDEQPQITKNKTQTTQAQVEQQQIRLKKMKGTKRQLVPAEMNQSSKRNGKKSFEKTDKNSNSLNGDGIEPSLSSVKAHLDQAQSVEDSVDQIPISIKGK